MPVKCKLCADDCILWWKRSASQLVASSCGPQRIASRLERCSPMDDGVTVSETGVEEERYHRFVIQFVAFHAEVIALLLSLLQPLHENGVSIQ